MEMQGGRWGRVRRGASVASCSAARRRRVGRNRSRYGLGAEVGGLGRKEKERTERALERERKSFTVERETERESFTVEREEL